MTPLLLALLLATPDTVRAPRWNASLTYGFEAFTRTQPTWHAANVQVGRRFTHGTVIGEVLVARRFDRTDQGLAVDAYRTLWHGAYGNLRTQVVPGADVLPRLDVSAEFYQSVGGGFEMSGGYRRMQYRGSRADLWTLRAAKYLPHWYLRARTIVVPHGGTTALSAAVAARRYLATDDEYLDVQAGAGEEIVTVGTGATGPVVEPRRNRVLTATLRKTLTGALGLSAGATYNATGGLPSRRGLSAGLTYRW